MPTKLTDLTTMKIGLKRKRGLDISKLFPNFQNFRLFNERMGHY
jgi:hypothetical protein